MHEHHRCVYSASVRFRDLSNLRAMPQVPIRPLASIFHERLLSA